MEKHVEGVIYRYISPSNKSYIGQTINEKARRATFLNIKKEYAGPKINKARDKYNPRNFEYEVIVRISTDTKEKAIEVLNELEIFYIKKYDSYINGYNSDEGGGNMSFERSEEYKQNLSSSLKKYYKTNKSKISKAVIQFSMSGDFIQQWSSAKEAADNLGAKASNITNCCKKNRLSTHGFIWRYKSDFKEIPLKIDQIQTKGTNLPLKQYTLDGEFIREWKSITLAAEELGYSLGNFSTYCNGRNNHEYKGFRYYRGDISLYNDQIPR